MILVGSVLYPFALLSLRTVVYLGWGIVVFGFPAAQANWVGAALVLAVIRAGLYRAGSAVGELHVGLQTRQSGEMVFSRAGRTW